MIIKRDDRILEARYLSREGNTGTRWWSAMRGRNKLSVFNGSVVASEVTLAGRPGQVIFTDGALAMLPGAAAPSQVATPVFAPAGGSITSADAVTLTCATAGASIYYTTDGTTPTAASILYTIPFTLSIGAPVAKAVGVKTGFVDSTIAVASFTVTAAPVYSVVWTDSGLTRSNSASYIQFSVRSTLALPASRKIYFEVIAYDAPNPLNRVQIGLIKSTTPAHPTALGHILGLSADEYVTQIPNPDDAGVYVYNRSPNVLSGTAKTTVGTPVGIMWDGVNGALSIKALNTGGASQSVFSVKTGMSASTWYLCFGGSSSASAAVVQAEMFVTPASLVYSVPSGYEAGWSD